MAQNYPHGPQIPYGASADALYPPPQQNYPAVPQTSYEASHQLNLMPFTRVYPHVPEPPYGASAEKNPVPFPEYYPEVPQTHYGTSDQTSNSQPPYPVMVFQVNLQTLQYYSWCLPNRTYLEGNETVTEAANMKYTRSTWLPSLYSGVENLVHLEGNTITAYGEKAVYLRNTYATGKPDAVLVLVSST